MHEDLNVRFVYIYEIVAQKKLLLYRWPLFH